MLHHVLSERLAIQEMVYRLDQRSTLAHVAELLHYLARRISTLDIICMRRNPGVIHGPTQKDLTDALGLSLASVEKSMRVLRKPDVIASPGRGRANRSYAVLDPETPMAVALGSPLAA
ncbi:hypothetical protein [Streptomyces termitum]|uniref:hypothetical protein n=1 Tax=Streptomyces termitum TaxID=67368 RepID=UPI0037B75A39